jgi:glycosyltransferase involved in cell wall biosynthesis
MFRVEGPDMDLSVVVPTLNGRDRLASCLDALADAAPTAEVVVVNGPSADGTTGMVRDREDVDVLVEVSARTLNVARNAGIEVATGETVAFLRHDVVVEADWLDAVESGVADPDVDVVTGPVRRALRAGATSESPESRTIAGRKVTYFAGGNVVFTRETLDALDGFDEYLEIGGARDAAHRLAGLDRTVAWRPTVDARVESGVGSDGGRDSEEWGWKYRALAYRLAKNYGVRPTVFRRTASHAAEDGALAARDVLGGEARPTAWAGAGRAVLGGIATGFSDGLVARARDRTPRRNPHGVSARNDRAVARYDRR